MVQRVSRYRAMELTLIRRDCCRALFMLLFFFSVHYLHLLPQPSQLGVPPQPLMAMLLPFQSFFFVLMTAYEDTQVICAVYLSVVPT